ncbi:MAG: hypothetical protein K2W95_28805 [Candidatus Obscuribacterales bacterium]|nr:hypothetical protein [Candidatus Obscuribacterales bacterium]
MKINYASGKVSEEYHCHKCGNSLLKLWRQYQTTQPKLLCSVCVLQDQKQTGEFFDELGYRKGEYGKTDQCGCYVPAIPDEEGAGFWGYTSVPPEGVAWWRGLPTVSTK